MTPDVNIYAEALARAQSELDSLRGEFERLATRKSQLEAFIANTQPLVGTPAVMRVTVSHPSADHATSLATALPPQPIWKSIVLSINGKGDRFSINDALQALERIGRGVAGPNAYKIVRNVLNTKEQNFEKMGPGLYRVKKGQEATEVAS